MGLCLHNFSARKIQNSQRFICQINQIREAQCSSGLLATNVQVEDKKAMDRGGHCEATTWLRANAWRMMCGRVAS